MYHGGPAAVLDPVYDPRNRDDIPVKDEDHIDLRLEAVLKFLLILDRRNNW